MDLIEHPLLFVLIREFVFLFVDGAMPHCPGNPAYDGYTFPE
jgi:hypothetical protein